MFCQIPAQSRSNLVRECAGYKLKQIGADKCCWDEKLDHNWDVRRVYNRCQFTAERSIPHVQPKNRDQLRSR
jgi:hypothetical protein